MYSSFQYYDHNLNKHLNTYVLHFTSQTVLNSFLLRLQVYPRFLPLDDKTVPISVGFTDTSV